MERDYSKERITDRAHPYLIGGLAILAVPIALWWQFGDMVYTPKSTYKNSTLSQTRQVVGKFNDADALPDTLEFAMQDNPTFETDGKFKITNPDGTITQLVKPVQVRDGKVYFVQDDRVQIHDL